MTTPEELYATNNSKPIILRFKVRLHLRAKLRHRSDQRSERLLHSKSKSTISRKSKARTCSWPPDALQLWTKSELSACKKTCTPNNCENHRQNEEECIPHSDCTNHTITDLQRRSKNMVMEGLEVFRSEIEGHGIKTLVRVNKGQAILEYRGDIFSEEELSEKMVSCFLISCL